VGGKQRVEGVENKRVKKTGLKFLNLTF
jgi:hypothetical protein